MAVLLLPGSALSAGAGTITMKTETRAVLEAGTLAVQINVLNSGDETARSVMAAASFGGRDVHGEARAALPPGTAMDVVLRLPWTPGKGQWPLTSTIDYTDGRGYALQALHVALVSSTDAAPALVAIVDFTMDPVVTSGNLIVRLKNLSPLSQDARLSFSVPLGLEVENPVRPLFLEPWGDAEVKARIVNRTALAGSRYVAFAVVEYDDGEGHHAALARGAVEIRGAGTTRGRSLLFTAAALTTAWILFMAWRRRQDRRGGSPPSAAPVT